MKNRTMRVLIAVVFVFSFVMLITSCAKKQVVSETAQPEAKAEEVKPAPKVEMKETKDYQAEERARQERLKALAAEQKAEEDFRRFQETAIYFDFDKSDLKPEAQAELRSVAFFMRQYPQYRVLVAGHCDERGTAEYNLALGERRAYAAKKFLMALGIPESRLMTVSYGEEKPVDPGHNETAWAMNRRAEFKAMKY